MRSLRTVVYVSISVLFGLTLAAAAGLKAGELAFAETGIPTSELDHTPSAVLGVWLGVEFILGMFLISGARPATARVAAIVILLAFCCKTLSQVVTDKRDCGCFGPVGVSPTITLMFDLSFLAGFLFFGPPAGGEYRIRRGAIASAVALSAGLALFPPLLRSGPAERFAVIDPSDWKGQQFPLIDDTDVAERIGLGRWLVVLYRPGCEECQREVPRFAEKARSRKFSVALIQVPIAGKATSDGDWNGVTYGHLRADRTWVVRTPLAVWLQDGIVTGMDSDSP